MLLYLPSTFSESSASRFEKNIERAVESIPILIEYLDKMFARSGKIPREEQIQVELFAVYITFQIFDRKCIQRIFDR